jgi:predicted oxidoreductase
MPFGGDWNRDPITKDAVLNAEKAVDAALAIGITMFDHADIYGRGKAEAAFGAILKNRPDVREQMVIQSKCGIRLGEGALPGRFDFSTEHILQAVDGSLRRLGIDYLDVLLLHRPDPLMEPDEVAAAFGQLKAAGKVRYFGVSNMSVAQIRFLQRALPDHLVVNQLEMSLAHLHWLDQGIHVNQAAGASVNFSDGLIEYC